jgi:WD40 repeat protein
MEIKSFIGGHVKDVKSWDVSPERKFSPDGKHVVSLSGSSDQILIWDISTGMKVRTIEDNDIASFAISPDGRYIATGSGIYTKKFGKLWDFYSGRKIKDLTFRKGRDIFGDTVYISSDSLDFSPDGRYVVSSYNIDHEFYLLDVSTDRKVRTFKGHTDYVNSVAFSPDGKYILSGSRDKTLKLWEVSSGREVRTFEGHKSHVSSAAFSANGEYAISTSSDSTVRLWSIKSGKEIAMIVNFKGEEWVIMTPEGFFNSSTKGAENLNVKVGNIVSSIDQFYNALYRPDLVRAKLHGDPEGIVADANAKTNLASLLTQGSAPRITFVSPKESSIKKRNVEVALDVLDQGGGIGKVVWKINGVTVSVEEQGRGIEVKKLVTTFKEPVRIWKILTLSPGANVIEVIAYNAGGGIASKPARLSVILKDAISEKPALYVLAVGINRYRDKSLWLKYAVPDAKDIVASIGNAGKTVFTDIHFKEIHDSGATLNGIKTAFVTLSKQIKTNDVFVLYLAGHGITLDGRYHFLPVDFRYYNEDSVREKAVNQDHLQEWMGCVKAQKSLVLLDTCNSGSYVQAQVVARGLAEKTAIDKLTKATGRATIAGSSDSQVAFEGYEGHGVFTYVLLEALQQADTRYGNRDGVTSTGEIASYVNEQVPEITYKKWGYEQVPQVNLHGREFPIGVTK